MLAKDNILWPIQEEQVYTRGDPWLRYSTWSFIDIILSLTREWLQFHHPAPLLRGFRTACPCALDLGALLIHPSSFLRTPENHFTLAHGIPLLMQYLKLFTCLRYPVDDNHFTPDGSGYLLLQPFRHMSVRRKWRWPLQEVINMAITKVFLEIVYNMHDWQTQGQLS